MSLLPGLPALPSGVNIFDQAVLAVADIAISLFLTPQQQWGIFLDGAPVILADNVVKLEYRQGWRLSKYPQEEGAFATYNKVALPFEATVRFSTGGSPADRQSFLDSIAAIAGDLNLYDVVSPEQIYSSCNVIDYELVRSADSGVGLIAVDVKLEQVIISGAASFSNTQSPGAASQTNNGLVQGSVERGPDLPNISGPVTFQ